ncbi:ABC transporter substrate-binding protein [Jeotgalibaca ciconiae]|uniref:Spermidine/putrescine ABC transporter substrate-binding protein n=1 Tax=Jeotgalibaca ciconiae TaxID=2496265 RepID=A0A3Q9BM12_9LACT|nr:spermidine/putrescine ABC transporter substrate-binding protein [Jeotgalibaca ciconiae]AZP05572.1 spermidine/putrescine ABC transporter substrate-binding protein [Jeotgalibaca ciconiae]HJB24641.1 spermidine/putrescine ABC transporter substrate-binding protein [Candidatus Jeotgalibaca pullicola]
MKKLNIFFGGIIAAIIVIFGLRAFISSQSNDSSSGNTVTIFNWGDYIDRDLITKFEEETGYHVVYDTFDSNEAMETKISQGGTNYDLVFPSGSIIPKMIEKDLLVPLDHNKIVGMEYNSEFLMDQPYDPNNQYTIPYFWGTVGIMVNTKELPDHNIRTWADLWNPVFKNEVLLLDGARESMGIALQAMELSLNEINYDSLQEAAKYLAELTPNIHAILNNEIRSLMINGDAFIGIGYSGDAAWVASQNPDVEYILPENGGVVWTDNFAIPKTVKNKEGAYAFINFMLRPENAKQNTEYVEYATPNEAAKELLPGEVTANKLLYPDPEDIQDLEHYEYLGQEVMNYYNELFLNMKMGL